MARIKFSDLDSPTKRAVFRLADEAETLTPNITGAVSHVGEIREADAFMTVYPKGSEAHTALATRLRLGDASEESVLSCIKRAAPAYRSTSETADVELDELTPYFQGARAS